MVGHAPQTVSLEFAVVQRGQEEAGEDGNNGDNDQQFNQRKRLSPNLGHAGKTLLLLAMIIKDYKLSCRTLSQT